MSSGVEPRHATSQHDYFKVAALQVCLVDIGDLKFSASARLERLCNAHHLIVVEVKAGNGVARLRFFRFFLDAQCTPFSVKFHHPVSLWVMYRIGENSRPVMLTCRFAQVFGEVVPVENIVAKHEGAGTATDEGLDQQKRLRDSLWPLLYLKVRANAYWSPSPSSTLNFGASSGVEMTR